MMERQYINVKGIHPDSRFENSLNPDLFLRAMERVWAMRLERETGVPCTVTMRFVPDETREPEKDKN